MDPSENQLSSNGFEPNASHLIRNVILIVVLVIVILVGIDIFLVFRNLANSVNKSLSSLEPTKQASVTLKNQYDNPFDKNTQYSNPFSSSQNPFDNLAQ